MAKQGRPTKLTQKHTPGNTHADVLINQIRMGLHQRAACDISGVSKSTLHKWTLDGSRLKAQQTQGKLPDPTDDQLALINFSDRLAKAYADAEADRVAIIRNAAEGGHKITRTTTRRLPNGQEEVTVVEDELRPEWTAAAWYLERVFPERYRRRTEITGADGVPLVPPAQQAHDLEQALRDFQAGVAAAEDVARQE